MFIYYILNVLFIKRGINMILNIHKSNIQTEKKDKMLLIINCKAKVPHAIKSNLKDLTLKRS